MKKKMNLFAVEIAVLPGGGFHGGENQETLPGGGFHGGENQETLPGGGFHGGENQETLPGGGFHSIVCWEVTPGSTIYSIIYIPQDESTNYAHPRNSTPDTGQSILEELTPSIHGYWTKIV